MSEGKHSAWNFWSAFVYFGLVVLTGWLLERQGIDIREMKLKEAVLIILATYRLTRVLVFEKIFKYLRDLLKSRQHLYVIGTLNSIATCPWCAGIWVSLLMLVFYYLIPYGIVLVYLLALAGLASMVILLSNLLHMKAEQRQRIHYKEKAEETDREVH